MPKYTCERCLKEFSQKSHFDKHQNKKLPCQDNKGKIEEVVENVKYPGALEAVVLPIHSKNEYEQLFDTPMSCLEPDHTSP